MQTPGSILGGISPADFLARHWQKQPLLIRQAWPAYHSPITPDELAGLACEEAVESRLVLEHRRRKQTWELRHGPFTADDFANLPETHWTLLVQECHKFVPELSDLLERFHFIPNWRIDDVMVSYAVPGGSVGPHVDQYDVFLLQAWGRRRWQISTRPSIREDFIPEPDLKILREFTAEQEWILEPGDMLYLPPGIAHWGTAVDECMTFSVGFRAPSHVEILHGYTDYLCDGLVEPRRYADPDLALQTHSAEISSQALNQIREVVTSLSADPQAIATWFGRFVTEAKSGLDAEPPAQPINPRDLQRALSHGANLIRSEYCRTAYIQNLDGSIVLFFDGRDYPLPAQLGFAGPLLCDRRHIANAELVEAVRENNFVALLLQLLNAGYLYVADAR